MDHPVTETIASRHPLDPLSPAEIRRAAGLLRPTGDLGDDPRFVFIDGLERKRRCGCG